MPGSLFDNVPGLRPATLFKKRHWHRCFPVNFPKFLRTPFSQKSSGRLLLTREILISLFLKCQKKDASFSSYFALVILVSELSSWKYYLEFNQYL